MKSLIFLIFYVLAKINKIIEIKKVFLLKNNFLKENQTYSETEKGHFSKVNIAIEDENGIYSDADYFSMDCYYLEFTKQRYAKLQPKTIRYIKSFVNSPKVDKLFLKFEFEFTDVPIGDHFAYNDYKGKRHFYLSYKHINKNTENNSKNSLRLIQNEPDILNFSIKQTFLGLITFKILKLYEYISIQSEKKLKKVFETETKFNLYYFKNYFDCLDNLKNFVTNLNNLNFINDIFSKSNTFENPEILINIEVTTNTVNYVNTGVLELNNNVNYEAPNGMTTLNLSEFLKRFNEKFYKKLNDDDLAEGKSLKLKLLYDNCRDHIKKEIIKKNIFFPITDKYTIDFFLKKLYSFINKLSVELIKKTQDISKPENYFLIIKKLRDSLDSYIFKLQTMSVKDLYDSKYLFKYFSKLLNKEIESLDDLNIVRDIICDYYNMIVFIISMNNTTKDQEYLEPIFFDSYECEIIDGIEINIKYYKDFWFFNGYYDKNSFLILKNEIHYFINESGQIYFPSEILRNLNIYKIEILSSDFKLWKSFKVKKYLTSSFCNSNRIVRLFKAFSLFFDSNT